MVGVAVILAGCSEGAQIRPARPGVSTYPRERLGSRRTDRRQIEPTGTSGVPTTGETRARMDLSTTPEPAHRPPVLALPAAKAAAAVEVAVRSSRRDQSARLC